jgi:glycosyltransferase involved in cell wall biosynthesis
MAGQPDPTLRSATVPRVSVVIPTVGRRSLRSAVDSVCRQSVPSETIEIIVANDSPEQLSVTAALDVEVVEVFTGGGKGPAVGRNQAVTRARGDLIAFLDDDDWWFPHHIASALQSFAEDETLDLYASRMFQAHADRLEPDSKVLYSGKKDLVDFFYGRFCWLYRRRSIPPSGWVLRRAKCNHSFMDETTRHHEDMWWLLNVDRRQLSIRQMGTLGGVKFEHPAGAAGRHVARGSPVELINWAVRVETVRRGAGPRFVIGVMGRDYARRGMRTEWTTLMAAMPPQWKISWDYRLVAAVQKIALRRRGTTDR